MAQEKLRLGAVLRFASRALALLAVVVAVLGARVVAGSRAELARGDRQRALQDLDGAIACYRRAAGWYAPGNPYVGRALDQLERIATSAERGADRERALLAWRSIRGAIQSSRSLYVPHTERLARADEAIARLEGGSRAPAVLAELRAPERPNVAWSLVALAGWIMWTAGAAGLALRGVDAEDRIVGKAVRAHGTLVVAGLGLFVLGLALA